MQGLCKQTHKSACEVYSLLYNSAAIQEVFPILMLAWKRTVYFEEGIFNAERANSMIGQIIQTRSRHLFFGYYYERRSWLRGEYIRLPYWTSAYFCEVLETNIFVDEYIRLPSCEIPKYSTERLTNIFVIIGHTYHDWKYLFWSL